MSAHPEAEHIDRLNQCQEQEKRTCGQADIQRDHGEGKDRVGCQPEHLLQRIFRTARDPLRDLEWQDHGTESDPGNHPAQEFMKFRKRKQRIQRLPVHQAEIRTARQRPRVGNFIQDLVKSLG